MPSTDGPRYSERLYVPVTVWAILLAVMLVLGLELAPLVPWHIGWTVGAFLALTVVLLGLWSLARIQVVDGRLTGPGVDLPCEQIASVEELDQRNTRAVMGPAADPAATLLHRPWLRESVRVITVNEDPPYVLIGTRSPRRLADALVACAEQSAATDPR